MTHPQKYFIDSHCHFKNIDDVAIYAFINRLELDFGARIRIAAGSLLPEGILRDKLKRFKKFTRFFESDRHDNIVNTVHEMLQVPSLVHGVLPGFRDRIKIMTPLTMDFEMQVGHEKLWSQMYNLRSKIKSAAGHLPAPPSGVKILPFVGMDLRRWYGHPLNTVPAEVDTFIKDIAGPLKKYEERKRIGNLKNGDVIGVKLYPPLGFHVYPPDVALRKKYLAVYRRIKDCWNLPVTVHCQERAYKLVKQWKEYTNPANWAKVLREPGMSDLRINFGHFGGNAGVRDLLIWIRKGNRGKVYGGIQKNNWTWRIVKMLKAYPNTYADIGALDWDAEFNRNMRGLLLLDANGRLDSLGPHALEDKLLWASDYPFPLDRYDGYGEMFASFVKGIQIGNGNNSRYTMPAGVCPKDYDPGKVINKMVDQNPRKFLFGTTA